MLVSLVFSWVGSGRGLKLHKAVTPDDMSLWALMRPNDNYHASAIILVAVHLLPTCTVSSRSYSRSWLARLGRTYELSASSGLMAARWGYFVMVVTPDV